MNLSRIIRHIMYDVTLAKFALAELDPGTHSRDRLVGLFSLYRSGTEADPATRERVVRRYLLSGRRNQQRLGMGMLKAALQSDHWPSSDSLEFGARPRSHGYRPKSIGEQDDWFLRFLALAKEIAIVDDVELADEARKLVADELRGLWNYPALRTELVAMANILNSRRAWLQGWRAVRAIKYFDYRNTDAHRTPNGVELLDDLEEMLRPQQLADEVRTYVLSTGHEQFTLDEDLDFNDSNKWEKSSRRAAARAHELGMAVAHNPMDMLELSRDIFTAPSGYFVQFGQGLAEQSNDLHTLWRQLVEWLELTDDQTRQCGVLVGFLQIYHERDSKVVSELLDTAVKSPILRRFIVDLHTSIPLSHKSVQRLLRSLDYQDTPLRQFESIAWRPPFDVLSEADVRDLMLKVMNKPGGPEVVLEGLGMRLHGLKNEQQTLSPVIRSLGLAASAAQLRSAANVHYGPMHEHHLSKIIECCMDEIQFPEDSNEVLEAYFLKLKASSGYLGTIEKVVPILAENATFGFLDGIFLDPALDDHRRNMVFREMSHKKNPLYNVGASKLLTWCRKDDIQERLGMVAQAIYPFVEEQERDKTKFTEQALAIIESTQDPLEILRVLSRSVRPNGWSGSRANIIANRRHAFETLLEHDRSDIRAAAKTRITQLVQWEQQECQYEQAYEQRRREHEQRFEQTRS